MNRKIVSYLQFVALIIIFSSIHQPFVPDVMGASLPRYIQDNYIVVLNDAEVPQKVVSEMEEKYHDLGFKVHCVYEQVLNGFSATIPYKIFCMIKQDPKVKYIEQDKTFYTFGQTVLIGQKVPLGICRIGAGSKNGRDEELDVDIAIIDTGIDLDHPDLNIKGNVSFVPGITSGDDDVGHGTHVAGIAAARDNEIGVAGVAPGARLYAVKVLRKGVLGEGAGAVSWLISGVDWVTMNAHIIEIANMSLGGPGYSRALRNAIKKSVDRGIVYVVAAGNEGQDVYGDDGIFGTNDDIEPASYPEVATISAMADSDGECGGKGNSIKGNSIDNMPDDTMATFSNFSNFVISENPVHSPGAAIDLAAPGVDILSIYINGTEKTLDGTSMAAPHVAGCVALYIAKHGRAHTASDVAKIRQILIDNAIPQTHWGSQDTKDPDFNPEGLVNVK